VLPLVVGLAIGFAVLGRRRFGRVAYLLPALALLWAIWDHFVANWYSFATCDRADAPTLCGLAKLDFTGGLLPLVAIGGWGLAMLVSQRAVARHSAADPALGLRRAQVSPSAYRGSGGLWPVRFVGDLLHYLVLRSRSAFGWNAMEQAEPDERARQAEPLVAARLGGAILAARLRNEPMPEPPVSTQETIDRLTSRI
jgi:hypothetical protein